MPIADMCFTLSFADVVCSFKSTVFVAEEFSFPAGKIAKNVTLEEGVFVESPFNMQFCWLGSWNLQLRVIKNIYHIISIKISFAH